MAGVKKGGHPCFDKKSSGSCGRVHLPVAPKCNVKCNYCDRKTDCVNESRPGVCSAILSPLQAREYMREVMKAEPRISVAGIAGPGDPMANGTEVIETLRLIKQDFPHLHFCMSTNGLALPEYVEELVDVGVSHLTVTMNAVQPDLAGRVYAWIRDGKVVYKGSRAGEFMISRQVEGITELKKRGLAVKINTVVVPGLNDEHIEEIARAAGHMDVDLINLIPMFPNPATPFGHLSEPGKERIKELRAIAGKYVPVMTHCKRCRADAVGLLGKDNSSLMTGTLRACASGSICSPAGKKPFTAVASREGVLVNRHLGEADSFQIWQKSETGFSKVEDRKAPPVGCGPKRWEELALLLQDCQAVLAAAIGETPQKILKEKGIKPLICSGLISDALEAVYSGSDMGVFKGRRAGIGEACCTGTGSGCT